ncbi:hypothetical protein R3P38DRAFT_3343057 [Favolaschia claudopus]|uniref:Uncharacterized protein n=1 Tax=Favolaschia claudopus TaxID=2862362 RepID=A0AAW0DNJ6_9AGAR
MTSLAPFSSLCFSPFIAFALLTFPLTSMRRFTESDDDHLIEYLAEPQRLPLDRLIRSTYDELGPKSTYLWSRQHKSDGWHRRAITIEHLGDRVWSAARAMTEGALKPKSSSPKSRAAPPAPTTPKTKNHVRPLAVKPKHKPKAVVAPKMPAIWPFETDARRLSDKHKVEVEGVRALIWKRGSIFEAEDDIKRFLRIERGGDGEGSDGDGSGDEEVVVDGDGDSGDEGEAEGGEQSEEEGEEGEVDEEVSEEEEIEEVRTPPKMKSKGNALPHKSRNHQHLIIVNDEDDVAQLEHQVSLKRKTVVTKPKPTPKKGCSSSQPPKSTLGKRKRPEVEEEVEEEEAEGWAWVKVKTEPQPKAKRPAPPPPPPMNTTSTKAKGKRKHRR